MIIVTSVFLACMLCTLPECRAQLLTNSGAMVHVQEGAVVVIDGDVLNSDGDIRVYDGASLRCTGSFQLLLGGLYMERTSQVTIERNLVIDRFGICWRYAPGSLNVYGVIRNNGDLNNEGEINIGRP